MNPAEFATAIESLSLSQMAHLHNAAQSLLGREEEIKKFSSRANGLRRLELDRQDLVKMHGHAEADLESLTWSVERPTARPVAGRPGRKSPMLVQTVTLAATQNPKRPGTRTHARFALYRTGMTGEEYMAACLERGLGERREILSDLSWDSSQGFIKLS